MFDARKQKAVLVLAEGGTMTAAARAAGVSRVTLHKWSKPLNRVVKRVQEIREQEYYAAMQQYFAQKARRRFALS